MGRHRAGDMRVVERAIVHALRVCTGCGTMDASRRGQPVRQAAADETLGPPLLPEQRTHLLDELTHRQPGGTVSLAWRTVARLGDEPRRAFITGHLDECVIVT